MAGNFTSIPVLDYSLSTSPTTRPQFLSELQDALVRVGFFYLTNHSVSEEARNALVEQSEQFFDLPLEQKNEANMVNSKHFLGYVPPNCELTAKKMDHRETFTLGKEYPAPGPDEPLFANLLGPNEWPDETVIPGFRPAMESYLDEVCKLGDDFKVLIAEALDLEPTALLNIFDDRCHDRLKLNKYAAPDENVTLLQGNGPHKDAGVVTFLYQGTNHPGLEAQNKSGEWIPVDPMPGALIINVGRVLEALTGGVCTAATHRVNLTPENFVDAEGRSRGHRYTFPVLQMLGPKFAREHLTLPIPKHITDLVKDEKVKSSAEMFIQEVYAQNTANGVFSSRMLKHVEAAKRWYPEYFAEIQQQQAMEIKA